MCATFCHAQKLELPREVRGEVGDFVKIQAVTDGSKVIWYPIDQDLSVFPAELLKSETATVVVARKPGRYRLLAWTAKGDQPSQPAICLVIIGSPGPDPNPPGPNPPPPPQPTDPLLQALKVAYDQESDAAGKKRDCEALSNIYKTFHKHLQDGGTFTNWGEFFDAMSNSAKNLQVNGKVMKVQEVLQKELFQKKFPSRRTDSFSSSAAMPVLLQASSLLDQLQK